MEPPDTWLWESIAGLLVGAGVLCALGFATAVPLWAAFAISAGAGVLVIGLAALCGVALARFRFI